jgi:hypothetical protein
LGFADVPSPKKEKKGFACPEEKPKKKESGFKIGVLNPT